MSKRPNRRTSLDLCYMCFKRHDGKFLGCDSCLKKRREVPSCSRNSESLKKYGLRVKLEAFDAYGGRACVCCGESEVKFLSLDHVNNDGNVHRATTKRRGVRYPYLKKMGWPNDPPLQVLCMNCNWGKRINGGICPHKDS